jgi:DNA-binding response OmpR family regulator
MPKFLGQQRVDRALTAPPLRRRNESSLVAICCQLLTLTPTESRVLVKLVKHDPVTKKDLHAATAPDGKAVSKINSLNVVVCNLRQKLAPHDIEIKTVWGYGFRLPEDARDRVRRILAEYGEEIVAATTPPAGATRTEISP